jgi:hypothetical protein
MKIKLIIICILFSTINVFSSQEKEITKNFFTDINSTWCGVNATVTTTKNNQIAWIITSEIFTENLALLYSVMEEYRQANRTFNPCIVLMDKKEAINEIIFYNNENTIQTLTTQDSINNYINHLPFSENYNALLLIFSNNIIIDTLYLCSINERIKKYHPSVVQTCLLHEYKPKTHVSPLKKLKFMLYPALSLFSIYLFYKNVLLPLYF